MTKTYAIEVLENTKIQLLDHMDSLNVLTMGNFDVEKRELTEKLNNIKASIKTLNENRGVKIISESGALILGNGEVKFVGNVDFTAASPTNEHNSTQVSNKYIVEDCKSITLNEKGLFINAGSVNFVPCKYKWSPTTKEDSVSSILDQKWNEIKELINESSKNNITQNITFNVENATKDADINKFTKAFADTLKRQQGIR